MLGARYLDTALGRFISVDPVMDLADPQQWNAYAYANNNPVTWSDPTGRIVRHDGDSPRQASSAGTTLRATASKARWQTESCVYSWGCANGSNPQASVSTAGGGTGAAPLPYVMKKSMDPEQVAINTAIARQMTDQAIRARMPSWIYWAHHWFNHGLETSKRSLTRFRGHLV